MIGLATPAARPAAAVLATRLVEAGSAQAGKPTATRWRVDSAAIVAAKHYLAAIAAMANLKRIRSARDSAGSAPDSADSWDPIAARYVRRKCGSPRGSRAARPSGICRGA